jgi:hypothetical protein
MDGTVAILIPTFNGGALLHRTVASCFNVGLDRSRFRVIVVDNASTDASVTRLDNDVEVYENPRNLGRIGNWNRALEIAEERGFTYAAFLFVGDEWLPNGSFQSLLNSMDANGSVLGMAALHIVRDDGSLLRKGARVTIRGTTAQVDSGRLLAHSINKGRLPFAPIQANVYRVVRQDPLRFSSEPEDALNTDIEGTAQFLQDHPGPVSIEAHPYLLWRERSGRFFATQDPWTIFMKTRQTLKRLSASTGVPIDWASANAIAMLASLRETPHSMPWRERLSFRSRALRFLLSDTSGLSAAKMTAFIARKLFLGHNYLDLSRELQDRSSPGSIRKEVDRC